MRVPQVITPAGGTGLFANFGTAATSSNYEFYLRRVAGAAEPNNISAIFNRYHASTTNTTSSWLNDGEWHWHLIVIDGVNDEGSWYVDGTQIGSTVDISGTPFSAQTLQRWALGNPSLGNYEIADYCGPQVVWNRVVTVAEAEALAYSTVAPETDPSIYLGYTFEDSAATIDNRGTAGANGDLVLTGGTWKTDGDVLKDPDLESQELGSIVPGTNPRVYATGWEEIAVAGSGAMVEIWDPDNADGYVEIGNLGIFEATTYEHPSATTQIVSPSYEQSEYGYWHRGQGAALYMLRITVPYTDGNGNRAWAEAVQRSLDYNHPVFVVATRDGDGTVLSWAQVLGSRVVAWGKPEPAAQAMGIVTPGFPHAIELAVSSEP